ncbi:hypothetical protein M3Y99_01614500 [Aphelenchoides fujianensis]|nr:hypothetical protein M3Y99_01614500 [Aphelenchoides fujianensis]
MHARNSLLFTVTLLFLSSAADQVACLPDVFLWLCAVVASAFAVLPLRHVEGRFVRVGPKRRRVPRRRHSRVIQRRPSSLILVKRAELPATATAVDQTSLLLVDHSVELEDWDLVHESTTATASPTYFNEDDDDEQWRTPADGDFHFQLSADEFLAVDLDRKSSESADGAVTWHKRKTMSDGHLPTTSAAFPAAAERRAAAAGDDDEAAAAAADHDGDDDRRGFDSRPAHHHSVSFALPTTSAAAADALYAPLRWSQVASSGDLRRFPSDLSYYRRRIDGQVEGQRRTREIIESLQDKVRSFRQHQAEVEATIAAAGTPRSADGDEGRWRTRRGHFHRSMSSLDEELNEFTTTGEGEHSRTAGGRLRSDFAANRPASSGGRLRTGGGGVGFCLCGGCRALGVADFDFTISAMECPLHHAPHARRLSPLRAGGGGEAAESAAAIGGPMMDEMIQTYRRQMETILRSNETLNGDLRKARDENQRVRHEVQLAVERATSAEGKHKSLAQVCQLRLYDLREQCRSLQRRQRDLGTDIGMELNDYKADFARFAKTIQTAVQQACHHAERNNAESKAEAQEALDKVLQQFEAATYRNFQLEQDAADVRARLTAAESELHRLRSHQDGVRGEADGLRAQIERLGEELRAAERARDNLRNDRQRATSEAQQLNVQLQDEQRRSRVFGDKIGQLEEELTRKTEELHAAHTVESNAVAQLEELQAEVVSLQNDLRVLNNRLTAERTAHAEELERVRRELIANHTDTVDELEATLDSLRSTHHNVDSTLTETRRELANVHAERDVARDRCERLEAEVQRLRATNEQLGAELTEAAATLDAERSAAFQRQSAFRDDATAQIEQQRAELAAAEAEAREQRDLAADLRDRWDDAERRNQQAADAILELKRQIDELSEESEARSHRAAADLAALEERLVAERRTVKEQSIELESALTAVDVERSARVAAEAEVAKQRAAVEAATHERAEFRATLAEKTDELERLHDEMRAFEANLEIQVRERDGQLAAFQDKLSRIEAQTQKLRDEHARLVSKHTAVLQEQTTLRKLNEQKAAELEAMRKECEALEAEKQTLTRELDVNLQTASESRSRADELATRTQRMDEQLRHLQSEESRLQQTVQKLRAQRQADEQLVRQLKAENEGFSAKLRETEANLERSRRDAIDSSTKHTSRLSENQKQLKDLRAENSNLVARIEYWSRVDADKDARLADANRQLDRLQRDVLELNQEREKRQARIRELEVQGSEYAAQLDRSRRQLGEQQAVLESLKAELDRRDLAMRDFSKEKHALHKSISAMEQENYAITQKCAELAKQLEQTTSNSKLSQVQANKRTEKDREIRRLREEINQNQKRHDKRENNLVQKLRECEANHDHAMDALAKMKLRLRDCKCAAALQPAASTSIGQRTTTTTTSGSRSGNPQPLFETSAGGGTITRQTIVRRTTHRTTTHSPAPPPLSPHDHDQ